MEDPKTKKEMDREDEEPAKDERRADRDQKDTTTKR